MTNKFDPRPIDPRDEAERIMELFPILDICPECGDLSVRAKSLQEGGGEECINDECDYWFCF